MSHSAIPGSKAACASPGLIAACHDLLRYPSQAIHQMAWEPAFLLLSLLTAKSNTCAKFHWAFSPKLQPYKMLFYKASFKIGPAGIFSEIRTQNLFLAREASYH